MNKVEEGFSHKNFMLMRQRKLKIDGKDCDGTPCRRQNQGVLIVRKDLTSKRLFISPSSDVKKLPPQLQRVTVPQQSKRDFGAVMET